MQERQGRQIVTVTWCSECYSLCCWVVDAITQLCMLWLWARCGSFLLQFVVADCIRDNLKLSASVEKETTAECCVIFASSFHVDVIGEFW